MPVTLEGQVGLIKYQQEADRKFLEKFGPEKLKDKLDGEGVYAFGFTEDELHKRAVDLMFDLSEEYKWGDNSALREKYFGRSDFHKWFPFQFFYSSLPEQRKIIIVEKPFPKEDFESRLQGLEIPFTNVSVYRFADLTEYQVRHRFGGSQLMGYYYVDAEETIKRFG